MRDPKVFLFDEPLSNLDAALRVQMRMEIAQLKEQLPNTTMIYVTHDQVEAMTMADRIVVLKDGVVQQVGTPMELYENPQSLFVAGFIGSPKMNFLTGKYADAFKAHTVGVRSEHIEIVPKGAWSGQGHLLGEPRLRQLHLRRYRRRASRSSCASRARRRSTRATS